MPKISIIIVNFNGRHLIDDCLNSVAKQSFKDYETILVDNDSSDGSVEYIFEKYPWVKIIENGSNLGFAEGTNTGILSSKGIYILTLNTDTKLYPDFLHNMLEIIESDIDVGMCASKMLYPNGRINSTGICISRSGAAWDRGMLEEDNGQYDNVEEVFGPCAGAALYRKEMLDEIGLFDEDFFLYFEDVDIAFRAQLAGWKCLYTPHAKVMHVHGGTASVGSDIPVFYGNRNILWYTMKNFPPKMLLSSLPWIIGRNIAVVPYYILKGKGMIIIKSKISAIKGLSKTLRKRPDFKNGDFSHLEKFVHTWYQEKNTKS